MYKTITDNNTITLYRIKKDGTLSEICKTIETAKNKVLLLNKHFANTYKFKCNDTMVKLDTIGGYCMARVQGRVGVYKNPHHTEFEFVYRVENRNRYTLATARHKQHLAVDSITLDDKGILNNMLEFIATL